MKIEIEGKDLNAQDYLTAAAMLILRGVGAQVPQDKNALPKNERFKKLSDGWIRDSLNGIDWGRTERFDSKKTMEKFAELGYRIPECGETETLIDRTRHDPAIHPIFAEDTKTDGWYLTNTPVSGFASCAWCVNFYCGNVFYCLQGNTDYVRPVRASQ